MKNRYDFPHFNLHLENFSAAVQETQLQPADRGFKDRCKRREIGFYDWPLDEKAAELTRQRAVAEEIRKNFDGALLIGIGGSYLGAATILEALRPVEDQEKFPILWLSNTDPSEIRRVEMSMQGKRFAAVVITKSGGTVETLSAFFHFAAKLDPKGFVAITDPAVGELRALAKEHGWTTFDVPPNIGGRFSVLTAVGLFPALLGGVKAEELLAGAQKAREWIERTPLTENPAHIYAALAHHWDAEKRRPMHVFMPYQKNLRSFADWNVQLWAESLGKRRLSDSTRVGFTPMGALGTSDQHSLLQLFKEGPGDKVVGFFAVPPGPDSIGIRKPPFKAAASAYLLEHSFDEIAYKACLATQQSLVNAGVPTYRVEIPKLDAAALGSLFFFMETACALAGEMYGVNAFDQPGVEEAKKLLRASLN